MDIFGLLRVTWLPRTRRHDRHAVPAEPPPDIVQGLIGLADALVDLTERPSAPESSLRTLGLVQRRVERLLTDCGVRAVLDEGPVVPSRHEVVGARPAGEHSTEGWIAATVRQGYLHGDRLIRPQQVVAYIARKPVGSDERNNGEG